MLRFLPLLTGLVPVIAVHLSYLIAIGAGRVPACIPYIEGCTSISATGRYPPASYLFKAAMLPEAVLLVVYWWLAAAWLQALERSGNAAPRGTRHIPLVGAAGAFALIVYVTFLGSQEPVYEFMRRFGIYFFFLMTVVAQLLVALRARRIALLGADSRFDTIVRLMLYCSLLPFPLGALNLVLKSVLADADQAENIIEWIVVVFMQLYFVLSYAAWRRSGFRARFAASLD